MSNLQPPAGGGSSYAGFEYQFLASAWLALRLIFERQVCAEVTIEPSSHEDVEATFAPTADPERSTGVLGVSLPAFLVNIQIKKRNTAWTESMFRTVLKGEEAGPGTRGPKPRARPLEVLGAKPGLRFVLFTNAQVSADLNDFVVQEIGAPSAAKTLPITPARADAPDLAPRIGIFRERTQNELILDLDRLVRRHGHVPESKVAECRERLIDDVRLRMLGEAAPKWSRTDIESVFAGCGGRLEQAGGIVAPAILTVLERQLDQRHRLLLTGGPGIGKTELAHELARRLHVSPEAFEVVSVKEGISAIRRALAEPGCHLFFIEDPWGHDRLTDEAGSWANELPKLFNKATSTKRFLVTSRAGVRHEAFGPKPIPGFTDSEFELRPEHYLAADRREIMRLRLLEAKPWQRDWVHRHQADWLKRLDRPLTIGHFASRVLQASGEDELEINQVLRISDVDALAGILASEIQRRGIGAVAAALLVWSVHRADEHVDVEAVRRAREVARAGGFSGELDPERFLENFRIAGWFRAVGGRLVAHPTALTGMELLLSSHGGTADDVLGGFLLGLVNSQQTARAFAVLRHLELRPSAVSRNVREAVQKQLLGDYLSAPPQDTERAFRLLVDYSTPSESALVLLHALRPKPGPGVLNSMEFWRAPKLTSEQQSLIQNSTEAVAAARKFVLDILPDDPWLSYSADEIVPFLQSFGWNFEAEFTAAALRALIDYSRNTRLEFLVECALRAGTNDFVALTDGVLVASDEASRMWERHEKDRISADQAELDGDDSSYLDEEATELFSPVYRATEVVVAARRRAEGWAWLPAHPRGGELRRAWSASIDDNGTREEIEALAALCADQPSLVWQALANTGDQAQVATLVAAAPHVPPDDVGEWCKAAARLADQVNWHGQVLPALRRLSLAHRMVLATMEPSEEVAGHKFKDLPSLLSLEERETLEICGNVSERRSWIKKVGTSHRVLLRELAERGSESFRRVAVVALGMLKEDITASARELASSEHFETRRAALLARVFAGREDVSQLVLAALRDPDYRVRRQALEIGRTKPTPEFLSRLPDLAKDKSAPVRETCAEVLGQLALPMGLPVLVTLLRDDRDRRGTTFINKSWPEFHVARAAAQSLARLTLDVPTIDACLEFLRAPDPDNQTQDINVHFHVMDALGNADDERLVPMFSTALQSSWHVAGQQGSGYPLRRIAALCLAKQLVRHPDRAHQVDLERLVEAAMHDDTLLAGPALVALGLCGLVAAAKVVEVSRAKSTTPDRAILLEAALGKDVPAARAELQKVSGANHPARLWLDLPKDQLPILSEWAKWRDCHPQFNDWLAGVGGGGGVNAWLRFLLGARFDDEVPEEMVSDDRFDGLLPKPIGILSLRGMFGGE